ncbi:MAG: hypothetical protein ACPGPF_01595 [Pontibacterium sp.]
MSAEQKMFWGSVLLAIGAVIILGMKQGYLPISLAIGGVGMVFTWGGIGVAYAALLQSEEEKRQRKRGRA